MLRRLSGIDGWFRPRLWCNKELEKIAHLFHRNVVKVSRVPFLQHHLTQCGDHWRFSPPTFQRLYHANELRVSYLSWNHHRMSSVDAFGVGSKHPQQWKEHFASLAPKSTCGATKGKSAIVPCPICSIG